MGYIFAVLLLLFPLVWLPFGEDVLDGVKEITN